MAASADSLNGDKRGLPQNARPNQPMVLGSLAADRRAQYKIRCGHAAAENQAIIVSALGFSRCSLMLSRITQNCFTSTMAFRRRLSIREDWCLS